MIHTVKGIGIVDKAEADVFLEFSCFFNDPVDGGNLISSSSAFSKSSLNIWEFMVHVLLNTGLENFDITLLACEMSAIVQYFEHCFDCLSLEFWDWNENTFSSPVATAEFSKFAGILTAAL